MAIGLTEEVIRQSLIISPIETNIIKELIEITKREEILQILKDDLDNAIEKIFKN